MSYKRELYLLHKNRSSSGISIAGIGGSDEKHNFTVHMADTNKKLWDISYKKSAGFGGDIIEVKPCTDTLKDYEYTIYIEKVGVTFKARVQKENEVIATMAENLESINNRDYGDKYDKSFDIEAGDKDLQFSLRRSVPYRDN